MRESYYAGAYWGYRPESAEECARRAETFFSLLSRCHPSYARWYEQANSTRKALQLEFEPTQATFVRFFGKKKYQSGRDGFHFSAWTGHVKQEQGGMLMLHCGSEAEVAPNNVLLYFPVEEAGHEQMLTGPVLTGVMRAMALAWESDCGIIISSSFRNAVSQNGSIGTFVGWMTYITRRWGELPPLPEPVRVEQVGTQGSLITLTPERLTSANPEHVALGHRVQRMLEEQGILRRVIERRPPPVQS